MTHLANNFCSHYNNSYLIDFKDALSVDREYDTSISEKFISMTTYQLEFDIHTPIGKLLGCFVKDLGLKVENSVILVDPNYNEIEVLVEKKRKKIYFRDGWYGLKDVYNLHFGGWVKLKYVSPRIFRITINDMFGNEVVYPNTIPQIERPLHRGAFEAGSSSTNINSLTNFPFVGVPSIFLRTVLTELTKSDVTSGVLTIPWIGFCHKALPNEPCELTFVDYCGAAYKVKLSFAEVGTNMFAKFSDGWSDLCKQDRLAAGMKLKLSVTEPLNNKVVYVKVVPPFGLRTTLMQVLSDGRDIPFYMIERYFVPNA